MDLKIDKPTLRVFYGSDFHADFWQYSVNPFFDRVNPEDFDLFIFAGDVGEWRDPNCREIYDSILAWNKPIIMVPGNHEFYGAEYQHESVAISHALLAATDKLRVIAAILPGPWHPAVLAKQISTISHLTNGRIAVNIVSGWFRSEFTAIGEPWLGIGSRAR